MLNLTHLYPAAPQKKTPSAPDWAARFRQLQSEARDSRLRAFYAAGAVSPDTPLSEVPLLAADFETTGLDPIRDDIVSIGLVPMTLRRIRCGQSHYWVVRPRSHLRSESVVIHGITHSEVEAAPDLEKIITELLEVMAGHVLVVHHCGIERGFLNAALQARIGEGIEFPVIDTLELEARLHRPARPSLMDRLLRRRGPSIRLADSRARYNLPFYHPHQALTDALACGELLQAQVATRFSPGTAIKELWR